MSRTRQQVIFRIHELRIKANAESHDPPPSYEDSQKKNPSNRNAIQITPADDNENTTDSKRNELRTVTQPWFFFNSSIQFHKGPFKYYVSFFFGFFMPTHLHQHAIGLLSPPTYVSTNSTVNQQKLPFSDSTHLFADVILEWCPTKNKKCFILFQKRIDFVNPLSILLFNKEF